MKKILTGICLIAVAMTGCKKYDDGYLDAKLPKTIAYFASFQEYTRTVVVGEGLEFKIGAAMAGVLKNPKDQTVELQIGSVLYKTSPTDSRELLPTNYYNSAQLGAKTLVTIPAGEFIGYMTIKLDSAFFVNDPKSMYRNLNALEGYTIPVKILSTSLDSIGKGLDSIKVSLKYIAGVDGYYLYNNIIKKEVAGVIIDSKTQIDSASSEADNSTWRLLTQGPYKVKATSAATAFTSGLNFNLTVDANKAITYESNTGQPVVTAEGTNTYDSKTRDFILNYNYKKANVADTIYHVSSKLIFRNRVRDRVIETRDYLSYFNK
ncbi:MAG: DUF1735 domain-containing protein [Ferruginibacter sp.]